MVADGPLPNGSSVTPPRTPTLTMLWPPPPCARSHESGRNTSEAFAPSGRPASIITPRSGGRFGVTTAVAVESDAVTWAGAGRAHSTVAAAAATCESWRAVGRITMIVGKIFRYLKYYFS